MYANYILMAALAGLFTYAMTAIGAGGVFLSKDPSRKFLDISLGVAAGIMLAASFWSLLGPALEMSEHLGFLSICMVTFGFLTGGACLYAVNKLVPHFHPSANLKDGPKSEWNKVILLVIAIAIHNIPEGMAVGVAFGALSFGDGFATLGGAISLTIGIGIQNLPEGLAVALPLRNLGLSRKKAFFIGQLSGLIELVMAILGAYLVHLAKPILPFSLAFAAGAMVFVVFEEVIPEANSAGNGALATIGAMVGFSIMMFLDVAFG